jgi:hypothetical protein
VKNTRISARRKLKSPNNRLRSPKKRSHKAKGRGESKFPLALRLFIRTIILTTSSNPLALGLAKAYFEPPRAILFDALAATSAIGQR